MARRSVVFVILLALLGLGARQVTSAQASDVGARPDSSSKGPPRSSISTRVIILEGTAAVRSLLSDSYQLANFEAQCQLGTWDLTVRDLGIVESPETHATAVSASILPGSGVGYGSGTRYALVGTDGFVRRAASTGEPFQVSGTVTFLAVPLPRPSRIRKPPLPGTVVVELLLSFSAAGVLTEAQGTFPKP